MSIHTTLDQVVSSTPRDLFDGVDHLTPWRRLRQVGLQPGESLSAGDDEEVACLLLQGWGRAGDGQPLSAPAAVVACAREAVFRAISPASLLCAHVDLAPGRGQDALRWAHFDPRQLQWRDSIHGGSGRIATRHVWGPEEFVSDGWIFIDHAILAGGSSLGHHCHENLEEAFVVLAGRGWMTIGDETFDVGRGSVTYHGIGTGHGLHNPYDEELNFLRLAVGVPGQRWTTVDLDDDLRSRRPGRPE